VGVGEGLEFHSVGLANCLGLAGWFLETTPVLVCRSPRFCLAWVFCVRACVRVRACVL